MRPGAWHKAAVLALLGAGSGACELALSNFSAESYTDMTGYVLDNVTGLWWQQPIDVPNDMGTSCSKGCSETDALAYCNGLSLAGHSDWRLPALSELQSIVDTTEFPAINATAFPGTPPDVFWTSSQYDQQACNAGGAGVVYFSSGYSSCYTEGSTARVRCVR